MTKSPFLSETNPGDQVASRQAGWWGRFATRLFASLIVAYLGIVVYLWANETRLVYPGADVSRGDWTSSDLVHEEVTLRGEDGTPIGAWYLPAKNPKHHVVVFHGNAENVAMTCVEYGHRIRVELNADVLVFDYRGFGKTPGRPDEANVLADGRAAVRWMMEHHNVKSGEVIYYGSSIGGGAAVGVSVDLPPKAMLLDRTFSSLIYPAQRQYPWIPVALIMSNRFESQRRIATYKGPVFVSHFEDDELIPIASARDLYEAAVEAFPKEFLMMPGGDHLAPLPESYWTQLRTFVERIEVRRDIP